MMKKILILIALIPTLAVAQDKIVMTDGNVKQGNITSENGKYVRYVDSNNQTLSIKKDYIKEIQYESAKKRNDLAIKSSTQNGSLGYNILSYNFFGLVYKNIGFSYERILKNGNIGIKLPVSFSLGDFEAYTDRGHVFQTGLDINIYPLGQGELQYFLGPSLRFGEMISQSDGSYYDAQTQQYINEDPKESSYIGFMFNNGVLWQPTSNFSLSSNAGIGLRGYESEDFNEGVSEVFFYMEASVGYRF
tara:strand:+ start:50176 stop:50916 length:741 start_codon:yes stop_codon:yes gene_type:complete